MDVRGSIVNQKLYLGEAESPKCRNRERVATFYIFYNKSYQITDNDI